MRNLDTCKNDQQDGNFQNLSIEAVTKNPTNVWIDVVERVNLFK